LKGKVFKLSEEDFLKYKLYDGRYWEIFIYENQYYLGRVYIWQKGKFDQKKQEYSSLKENDFFEMDENLRNEFFELGKKVKRALDNLFQIDLLNIAALGNISVHLHIHIIPRYKTMREFDGVVFTDKNWGKNYAPYNYDFKIPGSTFLKIKNVLISELNTSK